MSEPSELMETAPPITLDKLAVNSLNPEVGGCLLYLVIYVSSISIWSVVNEICKSSTFIFEGKLKLLLFNNSLYFKIIVFLITSLYILYELHNYRL